MSRKLNFILGLMMCGAAFAAPVPLDHIVAIVNDNVITESQLNQQVAKEKLQATESHTELPANKVLRRQALNRLIDVTLQKQIAKNLGMEVSQENLDRAIEDIARKNNVTTAQLREKLQAENISYEKYQSEIRDELLLNEVQRHELSQSIKVTDQEVDDYLNSAAKVNADTAEYHLQDALITVAESPTTEQIDNAKQQADNLLQILRKNSDFQQAVAAETAKNSNIQVSDLGWRKAAELPEVFLSHLNHVNNGALIGPIRAPNGFHILKLVEKRIEKRSESTSHKIIQYHVRHILLKQNAITMDSELKARLLHIKNEISQGVKFSVLAEKNSQDPGSAGKGGDMGWVTAEMLDPEFARVMEQTPINRISAPVKSAFGWHLLQVIDKRTVDNTKEYMRNQVKEQLFRRKAQEAVQNWLRQVRSQAYVKIMDKSLLSSESAS